MPDLQSLYFNDLQDDVVDTTRVEMTPLEVELTPQVLLQALLPIVGDLSLDLPEGERYRRLLTALRRLFPCDAVALLRLDGEMLVPLAIDGLSEDTLGRRFRVADHPRFAALLDHTGPLRFAADSPLPDPYDGLVDGVRGHLPVHECLGCALVIDGRPWGLVTLDALDPARFAAIDMASLHTFLSLAAATVGVVARIDALARLGEEERGRAEAFRQQASALTGAELIGTSAQHRALMEEIGIVAPSDLTVLITGETGVGKELVASAIHARSARSAKPFIRVNCAALPEHLAESELFGHVRGAFSGATTDRRGKFDIAAGGTLFLDEVGELPLALQAKLLRVLQSGELQRVGSDREHKVDVRLVAATNRDLAEEVKQGRFRADFYHRLSVYPLRVSPLRERRADVLLLCGYFLEVNRARLGLSSLRLATDAQTALLAYDWPGNVRELEHLIARSALKATAGQGRRARRIVTLAASDLALVPSGQTDVPIAVEEGDSAPVTGYRDAVLAFERQVVLQALARHHDNRAAAARSLDMDRANLNRLIVRLGLK
jgi:anaerobic nitric oxide reductase transcription regulator